jgi:predicted amidohydrolase
MTRPVRIATCQYPIEAVGSLSAWQAKVGRLVAEAADRGAQLVVMPEYASMELTSALPDRDQGDLARELAGLQAFLPAYIEEHDELATRHRIVLVAGSFPERVGDAYHNRARVHGPGGDSAVVEKLQMTRFERERWGIAAGSGQLVVDTAVGRIGVAICYDSEFPLIVRRLVAAGAEIIAVPSCTDSAAGYHRVRVACQARALENQCVVVQAPTVGMAPWSIAVDENVGAAGIFGPPDRGFPEDGVIAIGERDRPGWVIADVDLDLVAAVRADGQVLNHRDWDLPLHVEAAAASLRAG